MTLHAVGSADKESGYAFGFHLDYDSDLAAVEIEKDAVACNDYEKDYPVVIKVAETAEALKSSTAIFP